MGDWKLIRFYEDGSVQLFNLADDIGERNNLAGKFPAETKQLNDRLGRYLIAVNAQLPTPNPQFNPNNPRPLGRAKEAAATR